MRLDQQRIDIIVRSNVLVMFIDSKFSTDLIFPTKGPSRVTKKSYFLLDQYFPRQLVNL